jgi:hypothetical protein
MKNPSHHRQAVHVQTVGVDFFLSCPHLLRAEKYNVIAGLDPAIHAAVLQWKSIMDHRVTLLGCFATCAAAR